MKNFLAVLFLLGFCSPVFAESGYPVKFDLNSSVLKWTGKKVTGSHYGELKLKSAIGKIENDTSVSGTFEVDMRSLKVIDPADPKYNKKLLDHLSSADFFNIDSFPAVTFKIKSSNLIPGAKAGEVNTNITGDLSVKGITKELSFPALVILIGDKVTAKATVDVDRTQFNIRYGSGKFFENLGDKLIYDNFTIDLELHGTMESPLEPGK